MKRVYLFCDNGMSTSMMAQRMQDVADSHNLPIECKAFSYKIIQDIIEKNTLDCILIGPQTKFLFDEIKKKYVRNYRNMENGFRRNTKSRFYVKK